MKKNINVNISGLLFNIDEDAYSALQSYLNRLKYYFGSDTSGLEILNDIEGRISEMFQEKLTESKSVITIEDVQNVIKVMGEPGEIENETEFENNSQSSSQSSQQSSSQSTYSSYTGNRKLYRDPDDKVVGGVSSGLSYYFGIAPIWIRLIFVAVALFGFGMSVIVYIILWAIIPEARTTRKKMEMRGEPINIDNIEKNIREEINNIGDKFNDIKDKHFKKKSERPNIFERIAGALISIIGFLFKAILVIIGSVFAIVAVLLILVLIPAFFATGSIFIHTFPGFNSISIFNAAELLFAGVYGSKMAFVGLMLVIFTPLIAIVFQGIRLIFGYRRRSSMGMTFFIIWITGVILLILSGTQLANDMNSKATISTELQLEQMKSDTLYIRIDQNYYSKLQLEDYMGDNTNLQFYANEKYFYIPPRIDLEYIDSNAIESIIIKKKSQGRSYKEAKLRAERIYFPFSLQNDTLSIAPLIQVPKNDKWRNPQVRIKLNIPKGKVVKYLDIASDDPVLCGIQDDFSYRLKVNNEEIILLQNDSDQFIIETEDGKISIDSEEINIDDK